MIEMGDVGYGHPAFDFLATAFTQTNLVGLGPLLCRVPHAHAPGHDSPTMDLPVEQLFRGQDLRRDRQDRSSGTSKLKVALAPVVGRDSPGELVEASVADAKQNFLTRADEIVGTIDWLALWLASRVREGRRYGDILARRA